jgi:hypothetical protein
MKPSRPLQNACSILSWFAIVVGILGLAVSFIGVAGQLRGPWVIDLTVFVSAAVVFGAGLVSLTILDCRQPGCLFLSWFAIVVGGLGVIRHSLDAHGLGCDWLFGAGHDPSRAPHHWAACIGCGVVFGAGLVSLAIIASQRPRTANDQVDHEKHEVGSERQKGQGEL